MPEHPPLARPDALICAAITALCRDHLPVDGAVLDLAVDRTFPWPMDRPFSRLAGVGADLDVLVQNPLLTERIVQDLNRDARLPFAASEFDAATLCHGFDRLRDPIAVLRETARVLRVGAPLIVTLSDRSPHPHARPVWRSLDDGDARCGVVATTLRAAGSEYWSRVEVYDDTVAAGSPLYAVISRRQPYG